MNSTNNKQVPRTVSQVRELDEAITKCDYRLDKAITRGHLETSIRYDAQLRELTTLMASVGDRLWDKYCQSLLQEEV